VQSIAGPKKGRNLIMCFDGTGNEYGVSRTNVIRVCEIVARNDEHQLLFYAPGVGTGGLDYEESANISMDRWTGSGIDKDLEEGYRFLMQVYQPGDKIFLFGFSRGAFTARSLAGMLYRCGLLHSYLGNLVEYASKIYLKGNADYHAGLKSMFARECPVHFIGVWDSVEALSGNEEDKFHDYMLNSGIKYGYHALSIDEKRKKLTPCLWDEKRIQPGQMVEQVWFAGVHADVGGGYDEQELSEIPLRWILDKAHQCGLRLDEQAFRAIRGNPLGMQHESCRGFWRALGTQQRKIAPRSKVHHSVKQRMAHKPLEYTPYARLPKTIKWVD
jgi:uncharacterized protein (DUF2235 family)